MLFMECSPRMLLLLCRRKSVRCLYSPIYSGKNGIPRISRNPVKSDICDRLWRNIIGFELKWINFNHYQNGSSFQSVTRNLQTKSHWEFDSKYWPILSYRNRVVTKNRKWQSPCNWFEVTKSILSDGDPQLSAATFFDQFFFCKIINWSKWPILTSRAHP